MTHDRAPSSWTDEEAFVHLRQTFAETVRTHPDIMEPWIVRLDGLDDTQEKTALMRRALASTLNARHPAREIEQAAE